MFIGMWPAGGEDRARCRTYSCLALRPRILFGAFVLDMKFPPPFATFNRYFKVLPTCELLLLRRLCVPFVRLPTWLFLLGIVTGDDPAPSCRWTAKANDKRGVTTL